MKFTIAGLAAVSALALAAPSSAQYVKVEDPTGAVFGSGGGVVVGVNNNDRTVELGGCMKPDGLAGGFASYYYIYGSGSKPPGAAGYTPGETDSCAGDAPGVRTSDASEITAEGATLNGRVNPNGVETTYHFEYGLDEEYGSRTGDASAGKGYNGQSVTASLVDLAPATEYHFRVVAKNATGTTVGPDVTFTTCPADGCPPEGSEEEAAEESAAATKRRRAAKLRKQRALKRARARAGRR